MSCAEDNIDALARERFFRHTEHGVLVEVGAARPIYLSISNSFRSAGWNIIAIEPNPGFCAEHRELGHPILEYAASDVDADDVPFFVVDQTHRPHYQGGTVSFESFSSLGIRGAHASSYETVRDRCTIHEIRVSVRRLDTLLSVHAPALHAIDLLTVDTEGWELEVMRGFSADKYRPAVIILENEGDNPAYPAYMASIGYRRRLRISLNDIYARAA